MLGSVPNCESVVNFKVMRYACPGRIGSSAYGGLCVRLFTAAILAMLSGPAFFERLNTITAQAAAGANWEPIAGGVAYARAVAGTGRGGIPVHLLKVDLERATLRALLLPRFSSALRVSDFATRFPDALAVFNGSFFDDSKEGREIPKGIVVSEGRVHQGLLRSKPWAVFFIDRQGAHITSPDAYRPSASTRFALQGFPRLVEQGTVLQFKPQVSQRTALGILGPRTILVLITRDGSELSLQELAQALRAFGCRSAINLDGGSSAQLWLKRPSARPLIEYGYNHVPVAIGVFRRP